MKKRFLLLFMLVLLPAIGMQAASLYATIAKAQAALPVRTEAFSIDALSYDSANDQVQASCTYFTDISESDMMVKQLLINGVLGIFIAVDYNVQPFSLVIRVKTPSPSQPMKISCSKSMVEMYLNMIRSMFQNNDYVLNMLATELDKAPMQCDTGNNFCYTISYNKQRKEIQLNYQLLSEEFIRAFANSDEYINVFYEQIGSSLKVYQKVMTEENVTMRISLFKGTANTPFKVYRLTAAELFGE